MSTPYIGFSNETLSGQPELKAGDSIVCPRCDGTHTLIDSKPSMLLSFRCGESSYLAAINGKSVMGVKSDVSGKVDL